MPCNPEILKQVPLFALLDDDELAVLASQVDMKTFAARQRIYKTGDSEGRGYVLVSGSVDVSTVDQDNQDVVIDQPTFERMAEFRNQPIAQPKPIAFNNRIVSTRR